MIRSSFQPVWLTTNSDNKCKIAGKVRQENCGGKSVAENFAAAKRYHFLVSFEEYNIDRLH